MKPLKIITTLTLAISLVAGAALSQDAVSNGIGARKAQMQLFAYNLGTLGAMAKGALPYDAAAASTAASNLAKMASLDGRAMWMPDSDEMSADNTRAKPEIWDNFADYGAKWGDLAAAAQAMDGAAGGGLEALQGAMGAVGGACGACHKIYRAPKQ